MVDTSHAFVQIGGAITANEPKYPGVLSSEDAGFYFVLASSLVFLIAAMAGYLV